MHQAAAAAAVGRVIEHRHAGPLQNGDGIPVAEGRQLLLALALMGRQISRVLLAPGGAVVVLQHHPHPHPLAVTFRQDIGHRRQGEFLHCHQDLLAGLADALEQQGLQVIPLAPLAADRAAVAAVAAMVEGHPDARWQWQGPG